MNTKRIIACVLLLMLAACGGGPAEKPPYPGIKLGKPYEVYGRWYEPHYNAHYDEIGIASWYGPGFHGGHTANGERFDQDAMTAAHKTLPLPSIVRVTNLDNGLSALIKVNDRGPFSHGRIIDLSKGAANKLGVIATGTAHVRVQFLDHETRQYVQSIMNGSSPQYAMSEIGKVNPQEASDREEAGTKPSFQMGSKMFGSPAPGGPVAQQPAPPMDVSGGPVPGGVSSLPSTTVPASAPDEFSMVDNSPPAIEVQPQYRPQSHSITPVVKHAPAGGTFFVQAGTYSVEQNATNLIDKLDDSDAPQSMEVLIGGKKLYRVMTGPYNTREDAKKMLSKLASIGIPDAKIIRN